MGELVQSIYGLIWVMKRLDIEHPSSYILSRHWRTVIIRSQHGQYELS
jgi:hypothetical protein